MTDHDRPPGIAPNTLNPRTPATSDIGRVPEPETPQPIDPPEMPPPVEPPEVPPEQEVERPARQPSEGGNVQAAKPGQAPPQPAGNRMLPSDNPNAGLNSYMDE